MKTTNKRHIADLAEILYQKDVKNIVFSPGSRCAPLVIALNRREGLNCISIVDERVAAFYALGMAQCLNKPVALVCTSGTALLNYGPALAEAYYQKIPLIVLSGDRPPERIDQNDGQTMRQKNVFHNYVKSSFELPCEPSDSAELIRCHEIIDNAINTSMELPSGPVHINCPFEEPLYNETEYKAEEIPLTDLNAYNSVSASVKAEVYLAWKMSKRKVICVGQMTPENELKQILNRIAQREDTIVLTETTSNLDDASFYRQYDRMAFSIDNELNADLIITIGGAIVSKKIKQIFKSNPPEYHFHIGYSPQYHDTFNALTRKIECAPEFILDDIHELPEPDNLKFRTIINDLDVQFEKWQMDYISNLPWCDFKLMNFIYHNLPEGFVLQLSNSTPVRYSNLWKIDHERTPYVFSNRGVSGIDGQISTAAGYALASDTPTLLITGDLGFFYDSNAFWTKHLSSKLKIVLVNNGGGGIFRFVKGPDQTPEFDEFFETEHDTKAENICKTFNLSYFYADSLETLESKWLSFLNEDNTTVFEIKTDAKTSGDALKNYFKFLRSCYLGMEK